MAQPIQRVTDLDFALALSLAALDRSVAWFKTQTVRPRAILHGNLQLLVMLLLRATQGPIDRHRYRAENRRRHVTSHRYRMGVTPIACTWDSIKLCIGTENLGSRHFAGGYTLADGRA